jgi:hypothetical protein
MPTLRMGFVSLDEMAVVVRTEVQAHMVGDSCRIITQHCRGRAAFGPLLLRLLHTGCIATACGLGGKVLT